MDFQAMGCCVRSALTDSQDDCTTASTRDHAICLLSNLCDKQIVGHKGLFFRNLEFTDESFVNHLKQSQTLA
jgi:hypothetical protein